jgi:hypothetical protein
MSQRMLTASCVALVMIGVLEFKLIHDTDIFWQIKLGQIMLEEGRIPRFDQFTYTHAGEPAPAIYPLAQVLYALLHQFGGWHLVRAVHQLAFVGSLLVAAAICQRNRTSPFSVIIAMAVAFVVMLPNADLRPQSFGLLGFAILLALARGRLPFWVKLGIAAPLIVVWQNMHPSVLMGTAALGGLAMADFVTRISRSRVGGLAAEPVGDPDGNALRRPTITQGTSDRKCNQGSPWELIALALLPLALQFATPEGRNILTVSRANVLISRDVLRVGEWLSPWDPKVFKSVIPFWLVLAGTLTAVVWRWDRVSVRDKSLFVVMTVFSLYASRFIIFWCVALVPSWAEVVERLIPREIFMWARNRGDRAVRGVRSWAPLAAGVAMAVMIQPMMFGSIFRPELSLDGVRALRSELPSKARIYNHNGWGGPLLLEGSPEWRVAVDGRLYFYSDPAEWRTIEEARAGRIPLDELEQRHRPDAFFLYPADDWALIEVLSTCPRWRVCYTGPTCVAFVRAR